MTDIKSESSRVLSPAQAAGIGRRRLLRAGLAASPVILALSGRSAMATDCIGGPSGLSGPTFDSICPNGQFIGSSHHIYQNPLGFSPGYWKPNVTGQTFQPPHAWPILPFNKIKSTTGSSYTWSPGNYLTYKDLAWDATGWASGTKYNAIFRDSLEKRSFSRILLEENGSLEWHFCAAYLNATTLQGQYAMTVKEVLTVASTGCLVPGGNVLTDGQIKAFFSQTWA